MNFKLRTLCAAAAHLAGRDLRSTPAPSVLDAAVAPRLPPVLRRFAGIPRELLSPTLWLWFSDLVQTPMDEARFRASTMDPAERQVLIGKIREAWTRARTGCCTKDDWARIASTINIGVAIAQIGIASDREAEFDAAADALTTWVRRRRATGSWTLHRDELRALDLALEIHEVQLKFASRGELMAAHARVVAMEDQARALAARGAPQVVHVEDLRSAAPA